MNRWLLVVFLLGKALADDIFVVERHKSGGGCGKGKGKKSCKADAPSPPNPYTYKPTPAPTPKRYTYKPTPAPHSPTTPGTPSQPPGSTDPPAGGPGTPTTPTQPPNSSGTDPPAGIPTTPTQPPNSSGTDPPAGTPTTPTQPPNSSGTDPPAGTPTTPTQPPNSSGTDPPAGGPTSPSPTVTSGGPPTQICQAPDGSFGSPLGTPASVTFAYELEVDPTEISDSLESDVLVPLERNMIEFLLPTLFPETCAPVITSRIGSGSRGLRQRRLEVFGIDVFPPDQVSEEEVCQELSVVTNECFYVDGALTITYVLREGETLQSFVNLVLERLRFGMENDSFLGVHPSIEKVTYVIGSGGPTGPSISGPPTSSPTTSDSDRGVDDDSVVLEWWFWLFVALGVVVCVGSLAYRYNTSEDATSGAFPPNEGAEAVEGENKDGAAQDNSDGVFEDINE